MKMDNLSPPAITRQAEDPALEQLAFEALANLEASFRATRNALERCKDAGEALVKAKKLVPHGQWLPWLEKHGIHRVRAAEAQRIASNWDKCTKFVHLRETLDFLAATKEESDTEADAPAEPAKLDTVSNLEEATTETANTNGSAAVSTPAPPEPPKSPAGQILPERLVPAFAVVDKFKEAASLVRQLEKTANELAEAPGGEHFRPYARDTVEQLKKVKDHVTYTQPYAVCPDCRGEAVVCRLCSGKGWVERTTWRDLGKTIT